MLDLLCRFSAVAPGGVLLLGCFVRSGLSVLLVRKIEAGKPLMSSSTEPYINFHIVIPFMGNTRCGTLTDLK